MVTIREARLDEQPTVHDLVETAFGDQHGVGGMVDALRTEGHSRLELVAVEADEVVGHVMLSRGWVDARAGLVDVLVLSPLAVAEARRGRGTGRALLDAAVAWARTDGRWPVVFLEGDPAYYVDRGWVAAAPLGFVRPSVRIPTPAFQRVPLADDLPRGALIYPDTFWRLDCVGLRRPDRSPSRPTGGLVVREATADDWSAIWPIWDEVVAAGETYVYPQGLTADEARCWWMEPAPSVVLVAEHDGRVVGTAKTGPNRPGRGAHVSSASFMVGADARGLGVGRALGEAVLARARADGYRSMQFNAVVEHNVAAVRLWESLGFTIVGTVPEAFDHPVHGLVGLLVMHRTL